MPAAILFSRPLEGVTTLKGAHNLINHPMPCFCLPLCNLPYVSSLIPNVEKKLQNCSQEHLRSCFAVHVSVGSNKLTKIGRFLHQHLPGTVGRIPKKPKSHLADTDLDLMLSTSKSLVCLTSSHFALGELG